MSDGSMAAIVSAEDLFVVDHVDEHDEQPEELEGPQSGTRPPKKCRRSPISLMMLQIQPQQFV